MKAEMMLTLFHTQTHAPSATQRAVPGILPGLLLATLIAAAAFALRMLPGVHALSPLILAILLGMAFHNLIGTPSSAKAGVRFSLKRVLRAGIVLLGLQLTLSQVVAVGGTPLASGPGRRSMKWRRSLLPLTSAARKPGNSAQLPN